MDINNAEFRDKVVVITGAGGWIAEHFACELGAAKGIVLR
jgi:hypothetical protein